jgi:hypothetical protein
MHRRQSSDCRLRSFPLQTFHAVFPGRARRVVEFGVPHRLALT